MTGFQLDFELVSVGRITQINFSGVRACAYRLKWMDAILIDGLARITRLRLRRKCQTLLLL